MLAATHWDILLGTVASCFLIAGSVIATGKWLHRLIVRSVAEQVQPVTAQVTNNGGSSMKDAVDRIEHEVTRQGRELDQLSAAFQRHLGFHEGQQHPVSL